MGTRADFYVGRGVGAEWLGSIAYDGHPDGHLKKLFKAKTEAAFRKSVKSAMKGDENATYPDEGWPWPWDNSRLTDYSYAFDKKTWVSPFGRGWLTFAEYARQDDDSPDMPKVDFPDMASRKSVKMPGAPGSGVLVFGVR